MTKLHPVLLTITDTLEQAQALLKAQTNEKMAADLRLLTQEIKDMNKQMQLDCEPAMNWRESQNRLDWRLYDLQTQYNSLLEEMEELSKSCEMSVALTNMDEYLGEVKDLNDKFLTTQKAEIEDIWLELYALGNSQ